MQAPLIIYDRDFINSFIHKRDKEVKLGECVDVCRSTDIYDLKESLSQSSAKYVVLGLPEDIGVRANYGRKGADSCWKQSLTALLNIQSNIFLKGNEILILGRVDFSEYTRKASELDPKNYNDLAVLREMVSEIDDIVSMIIQIIIESGKEAIVVGGGHNNSYGCIKGTSLALNKKIGVLNCDPHADFRALEGRHSGNGFSYAMEHHYLEKYAIVALHENYNSQWMLDELKSKRTRFSFFEDIFIRHKRSFQDAIYEGVEFINHAPSGLELDLDAIENVATSAITPSGISTVQAREYVNRAAEKMMLNYFHISEGAPVLSGIPDDARTGKLVSYLISDYIKARNKFYQK